MEPPSGINSPGFVESAIKEVREHLAAQEKLRAAYRAARAAHPDEPDFTNSREFAESVIAEVREALAAEARPLPKSSNSEAQAAPATERAASVKQASPAAQTAPVAPVTTVPSKDATQDYAALAAKIRAKQAARSADVRGDLEGVDVTDEEAEEYARTEQLRACFGWDEPSPPGKPFAERCRDCIPWVLSAVFFWFFLPQAWHSASIWGGPIQFRIIFSVVGAGIPSLALAFFAYLMMRG